METSETKDNFKTELVYYNTLFADNTKDKSFEIIDFSNVISLHQIRIIRNAGNIHQGNKGIEKSKTQLGPILNFSVFVQETNNVNYTLLCKENSFNEKSSNDYIIPVTKDEILTKQLIFKGEYRSISIAIYGLTQVNENEREGEKGQTEIDYQIEAPDFIFPMSSSYRRDMLNYFIEYPSTMTRSRRESFMVSQPQDYQTLIRYDSIRPQLLLDNDNDEDAYSSDSRILDPIEDETNYRLNKNDIGNKIEIIISDQLKISRALNSTIYKQSQEQSKPMSSNKKEIDQDDKNLCEESEDSNQKPIASSQMMLEKLPTNKQNNSDESLPLYLQTINDTALMIQEYLKSIKKLIFNPYMFEENRQENKKISQPIVAICLKSLKGSHDFLFESYLGIKLLSAILSLKDHANTFLEENGFKELFHYTFKMQQQESQKKRDKAKNSVILPLVLRLCAAKATSLMISHSFMANAVVKNDIQDDLRIYIPLSDEKTHKSKNRSDNESNKDDNYSSASQKSITKEKSENKIFSVKNVYQALCYLITEEENKLMLNEFKRSIKKTLLYVNLTKIKKWIGKIIFKNPSNSKLSKYIQKEIETISCFSKNLKETIYNSHNEIIMQDFFVSQTLGNMIKNHKTEIRNFNTLKITIANRNVGVFSIYLKNMQNDKNLLFNISSFISMQAVQECPDFNKILNDFRQILKNIASSRGGIIYLISQKEEMSWMMKTLRNVCKDMEPGLDKKTKKLIKIENFNYFTKVKDSEDDVASIFSIIINTDKIDPNLLNNKSFYKHVIAKQIYQFLQTLVKAANLVNDIFHSIFSQDDDCNLLVNIANLLKIMNGSLIGHEVVYCVMKEDLMLDSFQMLLDTPSFDTYKLMMAEISQVTELFVKILRYEEGALIFQCGQKMFKVVKSLIEIINQNKDIEWIINNEKLKYDFYLVQLFNILEPMYCLSKNFTKFGEYFKEIVNYTEININSTLLNRQFNTNKKLFPTKSLSLRSKKTIEYIKFYKTFKQKDSKLCSILSSLKIINILLKTNKNFIHLMFKEDIFSVILHIASICEYVQSNLLSEHTPLTSSIQTGICFSDSHLSLGFDNNDLDCKNNIIRAYFCVLKHCLEIMSQRIKFKINHDNNKDYNNLEQFKVVLNTQSITHTLFPQHYENLLLNTLFEHKKMNETFLKTRFKLKKYNLYELETNDLKSLNSCFLKSQRNQMFGIDKKYIGTESNYYAYSLIDICVEIIDDWTQFVASYENLISEMTVTILSEDSYYQREFLLGILSVIIFKPRVYKNRERYYKVLKTAFFDRILLDNRKYNNEKFGNVLEVDAPNKEFKKIYTFNMSTSYKLDMFINDFLVEKGHQNFISYFLDLAINSNTQKNHQLKSICILINSFCEWKDLSFIESISLTLTNKLKIYYKKIGDLSSSNNDNVDTIIKLLREDWIKQFLNFLTFLYDMCLNGILKSALLTTSLPKHLIGFYESINSLVGNYVKRGEFCSQPQVLIKLTQIKKLLQKVLSQLINQKIGIRSNYKSSTENIEYSEDILNRDQQLKLINICNKEIELYQELVFIDAMNPKKKTAQKKSMDKEESIISSSSCDFESPIKNKEMDPMGTRNVVVEKPVEVDLEPIQALYSFPAPITIFEKDDSKEFSLTPKKMEPEKFIKPQSAMKPEKIQVFNKEMHAQILMKSVTKFLLQVSNNYIGRSLILFKDLPSNIPSKPDPAISFKILYTRMCEELTSLEEFKNVKLLETFISIFSNVLKIFIELVMCSNNKEFNTYDKRKKAMRIIFCGSDSRSFDNLNKQQLQKILETSIKNNGSLPKSKKISLEILCNRIFEYLKISSSKKEPEKFSSLPEKDEQKTRFNKMSKKNFRVPAQFPKKFPTNQLSFQNLMSNLSSIFEVHLTQKHIYPNSQSYHVNSYKDYFTCDNPLAQETDTNKGAHLSQKGKVTILKDLKNCHDFNSLNEHLNNSNFVTNILRFKNGKPRPKSIMIEDLDSSDQENEPRVSKEILTDLTEFYKGGDNSIFPSSNSQLQKIYFEQIKPIIPNISSVFSYPNKNQIGKLNIHTPAQPTYNKDAIKQNKPIITKIEAVDTPKQIDVINPIKNDKIQPEDSLNNSQVASKKINPFLGNKIPEPPKPPSGIPEKPNAPSSSSNLNAHTGNPAPPMSIPPPPSMAMKPQESQIKTDVKQSGLASNQNPNYNKNLGLVDFKGNFNNQTNTIQKPNEIINQQNLNVNRARDMPINQNIDEKNMQIPDKNNMISLQYQNQAKINEQFMPSLENPNIHSNNEINIINLGLDDANNVNKNQHMNEPMNTQQQESILQALNPTNQLALSGNHLDNKQFIPGQPMETFIQENQNIIANEKPNLHFLQNENLLQMPKNEQIPQNHQGLNNPMNLPDLQDSLNQKNLMQKGFERDEPELNPFVFSANSSKQFGNSLHMTLANSNNIMKKNNMSPQFMPRNDISMQPQTHNNQNLPQNSPITNLNTHNNLQHPSPIMNNNMFNVNNYNNNPNLNNMMFNPQMPASLLNNLNQPNIRMNNTNNLMVRDNRNQTRMSQPNQANIPNLMSNINAQSNQMVDLSQQQHQFNMSSNNKNQYNNMLLGPNQNMQQKRPRKMSNNTNNNASMNMHGSTSQFSNQLTQNQYVNNQLFDNKMFNNNNNNFQQQKYNANPNPNQFIGNNLNQGNLNQGYFNQNFNDRDNLFPNNQNYIQNQGQFNPNFNNIKPNANNIPLNLPQDSYRNFNNRQNYQNMPQFNQPQIQNQQFTINNSNPQHMFNNNFNNPNLSTGNSTPNYASINNNLSQNNKLNDSSNIKLDLNAQILNESQVIEPIQSSQAVPKKDKNNNQKMHGNKNNKQQSQYLTSQKYQEKKSPEKKSITMSPKKSLEIQVTEQTELEQPQNKTESVPKKDPKPVKTEIYQPEIEEKIPAMRINTRSQRKKMSLKTEKSAEPEKVDTNINEKEKLTKIRELMKSYKNKASTIDEKPKPMLTRERKKS